MSIEDSGRRLKRIALLLSRRLTWLFPECPGDPAHLAVVFFGEIPEELLTRRGEAIAREESFREWYLVSDELFGSEWLEELRGEYGIDVLYVDNIGEARDYLLQFSPTVEVAPELYREDLLREELPQVAA